MAAISESGGVFDLQLGWSQDGRLNIFPPQIPFRDSRCSCSARDIRAARIFNKAAFVAAPAGQEGDLGRNVLRGFDTAQADLGVQRIFWLGERIGLRLRSEFFSFLNHPNFGGSTNLLTSDLFGRSTQTLANGLGSGGANGGFNPLYQVGGARSIQLALKLVF